MGYSVATSKNLLKAIKEGNSIVFTDYEDYREALQILKDNKIMWRDGDEIDVEDSVEFWKMQEYNYVILAAEKKQNSKNILYWSDTIKGMRFLVSYKDIKFIKPNMSLKSSDKRKKYAFLTKKDIEVAAIALQVALLEGFDESIEAVNRDDLHVLMSKLGVARA
ncbi:MAG: hypothetical protein IKL53_08245 [Lachnospiraceae bacterium]|nr:hypothetical protein [Lachnospiraceae bacterium]